MDYIKLKDLKIGDNLVFFNDKDNIFEDVCIESIEYFGEEDVYDIEIEDTHNFIANGVVSHNSNNDVIGYTLNKVAEIERNGGVFGRNIRQLCFRSYFDIKDDFPYDFRTYDEQMLWKEVAESAYQLARVGDSITYNAVYQQKPIDNLANHIKDEWINRYTTPPTSFKYKIISVDPSSKKTKTSDKCAMAVWGVTSDMKFYLLDLFYERVGFRETKIELRKMVAKHNDYLAVIVENKANGEPIVDDLAHEIPALVRIDATESKLQRLESCIPIISEGNLYLPTTTDGNQVKEQLIQFRGVGKHEKDDLVDVTTQVINYINKRFRTSFEAEDIKFVPRKDNKCYNLEKMDYSKSSLDYINRSIRGL